MKQVTAIVHYEMVHILKDKILLLLMFAVPFLYATLCGAVYFSGLLTDIPLAVVDLDDSGPSREVVAAFQNSPRFKIVQGIGTYPGLEKGMKEGSVRAGIVIPGDFGTKITQHRNTEILTVYDASNLIWGLNIRKYTLEVISSFNASYTAGILAGLGLTAPEISNTLNAGRGNIEVWYNPTYNYANYILMGLYMIIIQQIGLLCVSLTITREKEKNSWLQYLCTPVAAWKIYLGKSLPYFLTNLMNYGLLIWFAWSVIQVKVEGSTGLILFLGLLYCITITSAGFLLSLWAANSLQVTRYLLLLSVFFFMLSGYCWPRSHIPELLNYTARLLPLTWMAEALRLVAVKNLGLSYLLNHALALTVMALISTYFALTFSKRRKPPAPEGLKVNCGTTCPNRD
ncbi:MAG: Inner membrane transport permease YbhR [Firmicutes bacterium ADurb.Bin456]|nr:MAG: Inner membrane transport permease YbhR [Firmicutes bacterium ADurb.Bin456]